MVDPLRIFGLLEDGDLSPNSQESPLLAHEELPLPAIGETFAERFKIQGRLGKGSFGDVLRATDRTLNRDVAIKFLKGGMGEEARIRFEREAKATAKLMHPNVVSVYHLGELDGRPFIVYELVEEAQTLGELSPTVGLSKRLDLFDQVLAGVAAAHAGGIIHRDLKPDNILIRGGDRVYVADFGLARIDASSLTVSGQLMGTPAYMAPEQISGGKITPATDVWSLGLVLYDLLYERPWHEGAATLQELMGRTCRAQFERPPSPPGAPPQLIDLLFEQVLLGESANRLPDAGAFRDAFREARSTRPSDTGIPFSSLVAVALVSAALTYMIVRPGEVVRERPIAELASPTSPLVVESPSAPPLASPSPAGTSPPRTSSTPLVSPTRVAAASDVTEPYGTRRYYELRQHYKQASTEEVREAAERGEVAALRVFGRRLYLGWRVLPDPNRAWEVWERAAEAGCIDSPGDLARTLRISGLADRAARWEARAVEVGSPEYSVRVIAQRLRQNQPGDFTPIEVDLHRTRILNAVEQGDDEAALRLAYAYFTLGSRRRAEDWSAIAASMGSPEGRALSARLKLHMRAREEDLAGIREDFRLAYEAGDGVGLCEYARCLATGMGGPQDLDRAAKILDQASQTGLNLADTTYYRVVLAYQRARGTPNADIKLGKHLVLCEKKGSAYIKGELGLFLLNAAEQNRKNRLAPKVWNLAVLLLRGAERSPNPHVHVGFGLGLANGKIESKNRDHEAAMAFSRAATYGASAGLLNLGVSLAKGVGVRKNLPRGMELLRRAGEGGQGRGWSCLAWIHLDHVDYPGFYDIEKAAAYYERALVAGVQDVGVKGGELLVERGRHADARRIFAVSARQHDPAASVNLARLMISGRGGDRDPQAGFRLLNDLPESRRTVESWKLLGECYERGWGVEASGSEAKRCFERSRALVKPKEESSKGGSSKTE